MFFTATLVVFLLSVSYGEEEKYPEFVLPDWSVDQKAFDKKLQSLFRTMHATTWGRFEHTFDSDTEKDAYLRRGFRTMIEARVNQIPSLPPEEIPTFFIYQIAGAYRELFNIVPDTGKPAILDELRETIRQYDAIEHLKPVVADIEVAALVFPFALEVVNRDSTEFIKRPDEQQKDFLRRFYEFLDTHQAVDNDSYFMELVDDIIYGTACYLESLAADNPAEYDYALETLKRYVELLQGRSRGKSMNKIAERLEMKGKICPWKLPVFGSDETVDFSAREGRVSLITFCPVFGSHTLRLQYAGRLWHEQGLDIYNVDHRFSEYLRHLFPGLGLDWPIFQKIPQGAPDAEVLYFLKRYLGVFERDAICILIGKDGTVLNSNLQQRDAIAELEKLFGAAPFDITKKADEFIQSVADGKFLELFENRPTEEWLQLLTDIALVAYQRSGGGKLAHGEELFKAILHVYEKSGDDSARKQAIETLAVLVRWNGLLDASQLAELVSRLEADGQPRLADKLRWLQYRSKFDHQMTPEAFVEQRDLLFQYLLDHSESVVPEEIFSLMDHVANVSESAAYQTKNPQILVATSLACAKMLAGSEVPEIADLSAFLYGQAKRLSLEGQEMPLEGITLDGKPFDAEVYRGKILLVDFWATWCGWCIVEFPALKKHYEKYREKGFEIIGISTDADLDALSQYLDKNPLPWPVFADKKLEEAGKQRMDKRYGITAIPEVILIGRDGKVIMLEARGEALAEKLAELFPE